MTERGILWLLALACPSPAWSYMASAPDPTPPFTTMSLLSAMRAPENRDVFTDKDIKGVEAAAAGNRRDEGSLEQERLKDAPASLIGAGPVDAIPRLDLSGARGGAFVSLHRTGVALGVRAKGAPDVGDGKPVDPPKKPGPQSQPEETPRPGPASSGPSNPARPAGPAGPASAAPRTDQGRSSTTPAAGGPDGIESRRARALEIARAKTSDPAIQRVLADILLAAYQAHARGQGGDSYNRSFIEFLSQQTDPRTGGQDIPPMVRSPAEEVRDSEGQVRGHVLGWYRPGENRIGFTETALQMGYRGMMTTGVHELLHRFDNMRDGNPLGQNPEGGAEEMAYARMVPVLRELLQASSAT